MDGYIKLHRKILDNPVVCKDAEYYAVWSYLLLNATHKEIQKDFNGGTVTLVPGQLITGRQSIAKKFKIDENKVQRVLKRLEIEHQIEQQTCNKNRLITVLNWESYQSNEQQNEQQLNNKRTTTEQQVNTNKNDKNVKNEKNNKYIYAEPDELNNSILDFIEFRKKIKSPMTDRAIKLLIGELNKLSNDSNERILIIEQSIMKGWKGVFPLKDKGVSNARPGSSTTGNQPKSINELAAEAGIE